MKEYRVVLSNKANKKLESTYDYIYNVLKNPNAAKNTYNEILKGIFSLSTFPLGNPIIENINDDENEYHKKVVKNYNIIYTVSNDTVFISTITHSSVDINNIFRY